VLTNSVKEGALLSPVLHFRLFVDSSCF